MALFPSIPSFTPESLKMIRSMMASMSMPDVVLADPSIVHQDITIPGPDNNTITLAVLKLKEGSLKPRAAIFYMHGGGLVLGDRFTCTGTFPWIKELDVVVISVEYRLAPEDPYPAALEDCYTGLSYISSHASELGIDSSKILPAGHSAGGNLAAAITMLARDP